MILVRYQVNVFAILFTELLARDDGTYDYNEEYHVEFNNYQYFGNIPRSMYTLFNIVSMAEWP